MIKDSNSRLSLNLDSPIVKILNRIIDDLNKIKIDEEMENHDESYDILDDDELDVVFDENASDVDLDQLEQEITFTEYESLKIEYVEENSTNFKLAFCE